jgi:hypothetical protein
MEALWFSKAKETSGAKINWKGSYFSFFYQIYYQEKGQTIGAILF